MRSLGNFERLALILIAWTFLRLLWAVFTP